jgi:hypothetical protein
MMDGEHRLPALLALFWQLAKKGFQQGSLTLKQKITPKGFREQPDGNNDSI